MRRTLTHLTHTTPRPAIIALAVAVGGMVWPTVVAAQSTRSTTRVSVGSQGTVTTGRMTVNGRPPLQGACAVFMNGQPDLTQSPEGLALLRFKREIEGVATVFETRSALIDESDAQRMSQVKRGIDSLLQVYVRYRTADGNPTIMIRRGDSTVVASELRTDRRMFEPSEQWVVQTRPNIEVRLRALEPQVAAVASAGARVVSRGSPSGYIGVGLSGSQMRMVTDSGSFTAHCDYPLIETVDLGSPARRAGLGAGDTIIAYNGRDVVAQAVNYPQLLMPGKVVKVRVRRDGKLREMPVTVAERTADATDLEALERIRVIGLPSPSSRPMQPFTFWQSWSSDDGTPARTPRAFPVPSVTATSGSVTMTTLLGAQLNAVDEEFAESLGLEPGVLIMRVQPGSPAAEAGLRPGEMIRAVNGTPVRVLLPLQRAVGAPNTHDVKLTVSGRDTPARIVTIRW